MADEERAGGFGDHETQPGEGTRDSSPIFGVSASGIEPNFRTEVAIANGATIILVHGEIDMATCGRLRDAIEPHLGPQQTIVLDLSDVQFADSSCLTGLVHARGNLTADGGSLMLRNPSDAARRLLSAASLGFLRRAVRRLVMPHRSRPRVWQLDR